MVDVAIRSTGLGKRYRLGTYVGGYGRLTESLSEAMRRPFRRGRPRRASGDGHLWALRDVSLEIARGQAYGVIGRNGAGKTTLLKILSRITEPTEGSAELYGRAGSLLEVGTGFHPELTGRENVFLNGAILGMRRAEIARRFDDIVSFAEIERFVDTPVKRYSSGMYVRLAFAVAAHLEPDILIVDEVLAVGDVAFQRKCLGKMDGISREGRTVLFVSHNMAAINHLCTRALLLEGGRVVRDGETAEVVAAYLESTGGDGKAVLTDRTDRKGDGALRVESLTFRDGSGARVGVVQVGEDAVLELGYAGPGSPRNVRVSVAIDTLFGQRVTVLDSEMAGFSTEALPEAGVLRCALPALPLLPGRYSLSVYVTVNGALADWIVNAGTLEVVAGDFFETGRMLDAQDGIVALRQEWILDD
jgi:lipopolysaccharide transport system ATP-binding protein